MACCCTRTLELCKVSVCQGGTMTVPGMNVGVTGVYKLVLDYLGTEVTIEAYLEEGNDLSFPTQDLNENYKYTGKIWFDGEEIEVEDTDQNTYDCLSFQTQQSFALNEAVVPEP